MNFKPKYTITDGIANGLTTIERARGFLQAATISEAWIKAMAKRAFLLESYHTTHIEGTRLTLKQAETLFAGKDVPDADPDDKRELLNYKKAFDFVAGYITDGGPITEGMIREIHRNLVEGVRGGSAAPGEYRNLLNG
jgi:Fic family protein